MSESRDYTADDLRELSNWKLDRVQLGAAGRFTGVCVPHDIQAGVVITSESARRMGAKLIREADLHDAIWDAGFEKGQSSMEQECATLRSALQMVRNCMIPGDLPSMTEYWEMKRAVEQLTRDPTTKEN